MSMVQQLIAAIGNTERQIDEEISKLMNYQSSIDKVSQHVDIVLGGSNQTYVQEMINQLSLTKNQIADTIQSLNAAKEKLVQVKLV